MSFFVCPHCRHEVDIFSRGGAEKTARQFGVPFLGAVQLDPDIREAGDTGRPVVLEGEGSEHAKPLFAFAQKVKARVDELRSSAAGDVIHVQ